jgi:hypothetical protein
MMCTRTDPGSAKLLRHDTPGQYSTRPAHAEAFGPVARSGLTDLLQLRSVVNLILGSTRANRPVSHSDDTRLPANVHQADVTWWSWRIASCCSSGGEVTAFIDTALPRSQPPGSTVASSVGLCRGNYWDMR